MNENYDSFWLNVPDDRMSFGHILVTDSSRYLTATGSDMTIISPYLKKKDTVNTTLADQEEIDAAVREALAAPRRKAEIEKRVAAVEKIGIEDTHEEGTVLRWKRKFGDKTYVYAAIKVSGKWYVTGSKMSHSSGWTWEALAEWMTTGENLVFDLQVATAWDTIL